jgi:PAS domain S-box-containing protein
LGDRPTATPLPNPPAVPAGGEIDPEQAACPADFGGPQSPAESVSLEASWLAEVASTEGLFVTDERQRVRAWSAAAGRLLGYSAEEVVGSLCYETLMGRHPGGHPVCSTSCPVTRNARRGRGTASYEVTALARDGTHRYLTSSVLVLRGPRGAFRVVHMIREAGERPPDRRSSVTAAGEVEAAEALTRRELEVLRLFAQGMVLDEIAAQLHVSPFTVRNHSTTIQHKLGVRNRLAMVLEGLRRGLV